MSQDLVRERARRNTLRLPQPGDHIAIKTDSRVWTGRVTDDPITVHTNNGVETFTMTIKQYHEDFREWTPPRHLQTGPAYKQRKPRNLFVHDVKPAPIPEWGRA